MKTLALVVGHGPKKDKGAENKDGTTELAWNRNLADKIHNAINPKKLKVIRIFRQIEGTPPIKEINQSDADITIELHLNAYNGKATGTEMLHHHASPRGKQLAQDLQNAARGALNLKDRGLKPLKPGDRGYAFVAKTNMPAVIVESFFIDNSSDLKIGNAKKDALAQAYARALENF